MNKEDREHIGNVVRLGCVVCRNTGLDVYDVACEAHHIGGGGMGKKSSNKKVIGLCYLHHRGGGHGIAVHAGRKAFEFVHGTEAELLAQILMELEYG